MTAAEAVAQLCARKMTALQYAEAVIEVAETYSCLNAFSFLDKDKVGNIHVPSLHSTHADLRHMRRYCMHLSSCQVRYVLLQQCCNNMVTWAVPRCWRKPEQWMTFTQLGRTSSRYVVWRLL